MPRLVHKTKGKRYSIWLDGDAVKIAKQIDNLSNFFQMALDQAAGIIAMDMIIKQRNLPGFPKPTQENLDAFNDRHPLNALTQTRTQYEQHRTAPVAGDAKADNQPDRELRSPDA